MFGFIVFDFRRYIYKALVLILTKMKFREISLYCLKVDTIMNFKGRNSHFLFLYSDNSEYNINLRMFRALYYKMQDAFAMEEKP
jgi:hypothetical protein